MGSGGSSAKGNIIQQNKPNTSSRQQPHRQQRGGFEEREFRPAETHVTESYSPSPVNMHRQDGNHHNHWNSAMANPGLHGESIRTSVGDVAHATMAEIPKYEEGAFKFEIFFHTSGVDYTVVYQDGSRFFLHPVSEELKPFPTKWYSEGLLVTQEPVSENQPEPSSERSSHNQSTSDNAVQSSSTGQTRQNTRQRDKHREDDRATYIEHPTKGRIQTYMSKEKRNVHRYFDKANGVWVIMPLSWEMYSDLFKESLKIIKDMCPQWTSDMFEVIACLRACNYDTNDCIENLCNMENTGIVKTSGPKSIESMEEMQEKEKLISQLKKQLKHIENQLKTVRTEKDSALKQVEELTEKCSCLEVELKQASANIVALKRPKSAKPVKVVYQVEPQTVRALRRNVGDLHKTHIKLRTVLNDGFTDIKTLISQSLAGIKQIKGINSGTNEELIELRELYRKEALQRKLLYNKVQALRGNIRVFARCRYDNRVECTYSFPSNQEILVPSSNGANKKFKFDQVFSPQSTQSQVFEESKAIITSCVDGYNVCILAYGQTGSGKTYTMMGPPEDPGVNICSIKELLNICQQRETIDYTLKVVMIEIYNENVHDLLSSDVKTLTVQAQGNRIHLPGVIEMQVRSVDDIMGIMHIGSSNRATASTKMNSESSRSHLVVMIYVDGIDSVSGAHTRGSLMLCDLAGSERVGKTEATGQRLVEAASINKSLTALGQVFTALRTNQLHVPYRNSKLTHILQPALGGDAKACLFVAISPDANNLTESLSTLQFGSNARQVQLGQAKQHVSNAH